jgi:hypothetical protein
MRRLAVVGAAWEPRVGDADDIALGRYRDDVSDGGVRIPTESGGVDDCSGTIPSPSPPTDEQRRAHERHLAPSVPSPVAQY